MTKKRTITQHGELIYMHVNIKHCVCDQGRVNPACSANETSYNIEIAHEVTKVYP